MISIPHALTATLLVIILYGFASIAVKHQWNYKPPINPLKIITGSSGRASLSATQVFFFTLIVVWLAIYWVIQEGKLVPINNTVLGLLGIAVVGAGLGKVSDTTRFRVTGENWAWAKKKRWIENDFTRASSGRVPKFSDLITSDEGFQVARFQAVAFSLVVGISLLYEGATAANAEIFSSFSIDNAYLTLISLSQGAYVGGKFIGANSVAELNTKLDKVRSLELAFTVAVVKSATWWGEADVSSRVMKLAREQSAPAEYLAYLSAATEASEIVGSLTGNVVTNDLIQPELPSAG